MANEIVLGGANVLDSREIEERIVELETLDAEDYCLDDAERFELNELRELRDEVMNYTNEWYNGVTLILDEYFKDYAQELAEELGYMEDASRWPFTCIDWEDAANELKQDYTEVVVNGNFYWVCD